MQIFQFRHSNPPERSSVHGWLETDAFIGSTNACGEIGYVDHLSRSRVFTANRRRPPFNGSRLSAVQPSPHITNLCLPLARTD